MEPLEEIQRLEREIEEGRMELNRIGASCREHLNDLIRMSQELDEKIVRHAQLVQQMKNQKPTA